MTESRRLLSTSRTYSNVDDGGDSKVDVVSNGAAIEDLFASRLVNANNLSKKSSIGRSDKKHKLLTTLLGNKLGLYVDQLEGRLMSFAMARRDIEAREDRCKQLEQEAAKKVAELDRVRAQLSMLSQERDELKNIVDERGKTLEEEVNRKAAELQQLRNQLSVLSHERDEQKNLVELLVKESTDFEIQLSVIMAEAAAKAEAEAEAQREKSILEQKKLELEEALRRQLSEGEKLRNHSSKLSSDLQKLQQQVSVLTTKLTVMESMRANQFKEPQVLFEYGNNDQFNFPQSGDLDDDIYRIRTERDNAMKLVSDLEAENTNVKFRLAMNMAEAAINAEALANAEPEVETAKRALHEKICDRGERNNSTLFNGGAQELQQQVNLLTTKLMEIEEIKAKQEKELLSLYDLRDQYQRLVQRSFSVESDMQRLREERDKAIQLVSELEEEKKRVTIQLEAIKTEVTEKTEALVKVKADALNERRVLEMKKSDDIQRIREIRDKAVQLVSKLETENESIKTQLALSISDLEVKTVALSKAEADAALERRLFSEKKSELEDSLYKQISEVAKLRTQLNELNKALYSSQDQVSVLTTRLAEMESERMSQDQELHSLYHLKEEFQQLVQWSTSFEHDIQHVCEERDKAVEQVSELKVENANVKLLLSVQEADTARHIEAKLMAEAQLEEAKQAFAEKSLLERRAMELESDLNQYLTENSTLHENAQLLRNELQAVKKEVSVLSSKLIDLELLKASQENQLHLLNEYKTNHTRLDQEFAKWEEEVHYLRQEREKMTETAAELEKLNHDIKLKLDMSAAEVSASNIYVTTVESKAFEAQSAFEKEKTELQSEIESYRLEIEKLRRQCTDLSEYAERSQVQLSLLKTELCDLESIKTGLEQELMHHISELKVKSEKLEESVAMCSSLEEDVLRLRAENSNDKCLISNLEVENANFRCRLEAQITEIAIRSENLVNAEARLLNERSHFEEEKSALEGKLALQLSEVENLRTQSGSLVVEVQQLQQQLTYLTAKLSEMQSINISQANELNSLKDVSYEYKELLIRCSHLERDIENVRKERDQVHVELSLQTEEMNNVRDCLMNSNNNEDGALAMQNEELIKGLQTKVIELESLVEQYRLEEEKARNNCNKLSVDLYETQVQLVVTKDKLALIEEAKANQDREIASFLLLKSSYDELTDRVHDLESTLERIREERDVATRQVSTLTIENSSITRDLSFSKEQEKLYAEALALAKLEMDAEKISSKKEKDQLMCDLEIKCLEAESVRNQSSNVKPSEQASQQLISELRRKLSDIQLVKTSQDQVIDSLQDIRIKYEELIRRSVTWEDEIKRIREERDNAMERLADVESERAEDTARFRSSLAEATARAEDAAKAKVEAEAKAKLEAAALARAALAKAKQAKVEAVKAEMEARADAEVVTRASAVSPNGLTAYHEDAAETRCEEAPKIENKSKSVPLRQVRKAFARTTGVHGFFTPTKKKDHEKQKE